MTIRLPILRRLEVENYLLYPGADGEGGLTHDFRSGVCLIVGTNGLGKTTLINVLLRCLVGPFNPPKNNGVVVSARQDASIWRERRSFFSQRVGDQAANATARLRFDVGEHEFDVTRRLSDTRLVRLVIAGAEVRLSGHNVGPEEDEGEKEFRAALRDAIGASSFVAALQIIRQLVFVDETRRALLWDVQSQTAMLRDLLVGASAAGKLREAESRFMSADSRERNLRWQTNALDLETKRMRAAQAQAGPVSDRLTVLLQKIRADDHRRQEIESSLDEAEQDVRRLRLETERARLAREDARSAVEELRLAFAARLFPDLDNTNKYILSRFYQSTECRACGADVGLRLSHIEHLLAHGNCLVCESPRERQRSSLGAATVAARSELVERDYSAKKQALEAVENELVGMEGSLAEAEARLRALTEQMAEVTIALSRARADAKALQSRLPPDDATMRERQRELDTMTVSLNTSARQRREHAEELKNLLVQVREAASSKQETIVRNFTRYAAEFLSEEATLSYAPRQEKLGQTGERFELPRFRLDMTSAAYTGRVPRENADDVSESQREFIDLAYRMALIDSCVEGEACLIMETPEASLDGVFMEQAGKMLNTYGAQAHRQLIVTSNLSNAGMIRSLMKREDEEEQDQVINLFEIAAPTRAVTAHREAYARLVRDSLGRPPVVLPAEGA